MPLCTVALTTPTCPDPGGARAALPAPRGRGLWSGTHRSGREPREGGGQSAARLLLPLLSTPAPLCPHRPQGRAPPRPQSQRSQGLKARRLLLCWGGRVFNRDNVCESLDEGRPRWTRMAHSALCHTAQPCRRPCDPRVCVNTGGASPGRRTSTALHLRPSR